MSCLPPQAEPSQQSAPTASAPSGRDNSAVRHGYRCAGVRRGRGESCFGWGGTGPRRGSGVVTPMKTLRGSELPPLPWTPIIWTYVNCGGHPHPVAQKSKNDWGLHDIHCNVWEWHLDIYERDAYTYRAQGVTADPWSSAYFFDSSTRSAAPAHTGELRVVRGAPGTQCP